MRVLTLKECWSTRIQKTRDLTAGLNGNSLKAERQISVQILGLKPCAGRLIQGPCLELYVLNLPVQILDIQRHLCGSENSLPLDHCLI